MSDHDEKMPPRSLKVRITHPYFDNVVVHEPGAEITLADRKAFSYASMEWVEKPAPEPVTPRIETPRPPAARIETPQPEAPQIETPRIEAPRIDARIDARIDSVARYASGRKKYTKRKVVRPEAPETTTGAPPLVAAPPAADAATPAASLESSRRRLNDQSRDHSLPLRGVREGEVPSSYEGDGVRPLRHRETVTPPPLTGEEGDSMSSGKTLAAPSDATPPSEPAPPSGNEATAFPAPSGAEGEGSALQDTSAPPNLT